MPVITISREIGSQGDTIAEKTANKLGYQLVDKNTLEKVFCQYGFIDFKETYDEIGFWARFDPHRTEMITMLNQIIEGIVQHGNVVLLGRGGFAMLKGYADVLNVRIQAPFALRVKRVMENQIFESWAKAEEFVLESDRIRKEFVESVYGKQWDSVSAFDLVIDTRKVAPDTAVEWLETIAKRLSHLQPGEGPTTRSIEIDPVLQETITQILERQPA